MPAGDGRRPGEDLTAADPAGVAPDLVQRRRVVVAEPGSGDHLGERAELRRIASGDESRTHSSSSCCALISPEL